MNISDLRVNYNPSVDILSISILGTICAVGVELDPKIVWQYQVNHTLAGVTIIDFKDLSADQLYDLVDNFLKGHKIKNYQLLELIKKAI